MGEMIAQNASNKDSRSLNEPRDVGRRKRIGHSPPTNIPVTSLDFPQDVAAGFLENIQAKVGRYDHKPERSCSCVPAATWHLMKAAQEVAPVAAAYPRRQGIRQRPAQ